MARGACWCKWLNTTRLYCRPTLGANLRAVTRRVRAKSGNGSAATPYSVAVPVTAPNEWTVQAATGSNVNGASDADDWTNPVAAGAHCRDGCWRCQLLTLPCDTDLQVALLLVPRVRT